MKSDSDLDGVKFKSGQQTMNLLGWVLGLVLLVPLIISLALDRIARENVLFLFLWACVCLPMILYRSENEVWQGKLFFREGVWPFVKERTVSKASIEELLLLGAVYEGQFTYHLWWVDKDGGKHRMVAVGKGKSVELERLAGKMSERLGVEIRKDPSFYRAVSMATNSRR